MRVSVVKGNICKRQIKLGQQPMVALMKLQRSEKVKQEGNCGKICLNGIKG
jgi:hypothetical protein